MEFHDCKAVVTGGANGIGEAIGKKLSSEGADVIVFDIEDSEEQPEYADRYFEVDVRKEDEIKDAFSRIQELDLLINNAGVYKHTPQDVFDDQDFEEIFDTNVAGYRRMFTYALPLLEESNDGNVVNISSALAENPEPYSDLYSASKAAVNNLTISWAMADYDVQANAILVGPTETEMLTDNFSDEELREYLEKQMTDEFTQPEDVADLALHLASNSSFNGDFASIGGEAYSNQYGV